MKTIFKSSIVLLLVSAFFVLQSVKEMDNCEKAFQTSIDNAGKEYLADVARCQEGRLSNLCMTEANLYYDKQILQAYSTFYECSDKGKE